MKIAIRYFTGTGNTARACSIAAKEFEAAGYTVDTQELRAAMPSPYIGIEGADLLLVAFPVLGFSPPVTLLRWLARLPKQKGAKAATLAIGGATYLGDRYIPGWGADAAFSAARSLRRRGREILGIGETSYPDNFTQVTNPPTEKQCAAIRQINDPTVAKFVKKLIDHMKNSGPKPMLKRSKKIRVPFAAIAFLFRWFGRPTLARTYVSDDSCTGCGLCARNCPARAIKLRRGRPSWNLRCVACNRCINICPSKSILTSSVALALHLLFAIFTFALALSLPLPRELLTPARAGIRILLLIAFFIVQIGPLSFLLRFLARNEKSHSLFEASFTKKFRRYKAEELKTRE
ncbi:MAG: EFR1 family ferrodoxin [Treponemataceae bacterium]